MSERNNFLARYGHDGHTTPIYTNLKAQNWETKDNLSQNATLSHEGIHALLKSGSYENRRMALKNPNVNDSHIAKALTDPVEELRTEALKSPLIKPHHINNALDDSSVANRITAVRHPSASKANLEKASQDYHYNVFSSAKDRLRQLDMGKEPTGGFDPDKDPLYAKLFNHE